MNFTVLSLILIDSMWGVRSAFAQEIHLADHFVSQCFNAVDPGLGYWVIDDLAESNEEVIKLAKILGYIRRFATYDVHGAINLAAEIFSFTKTQADILVSRALTFSVERA